MMLIIFKTNQSYGIEKNTDTSPNSLLLKSFLFTAEAEWFDLIVQYDMYLCTFCTFWSLMYNKMRKKVSSAHLSGTYYSYVTQLLCD